MFSRTSREGNSSHSQHNPFQNLTLYLATEQLSTTASPLPYMDTACKKRQLRELQLKAIFNSVVSGSSSKGITSAQAVCMVV